MGKKFLPLVVLSMCATKGLGMQIEGVQIMW